MKKALLILVLFTGLVFTGTANEPEPRHPLSHISPSDTDLDMSDGEELHGIYNLDYLALEGLSIQDDYIADSGEFYRLEVDSETMTFRDTGGQDVLRVQREGDVEVPSGNINMLDNSITGFFDSPCEEGQVMVNIYDHGEFQCVTASEEVSDDFVNRSGDSMTGQLDMRGNNILEPGSLRTGGQAVTIRDSTTPLDIARFQEGGDVDIPSGDLSLSGTLTSGTVPWSRLSNHVSVDPGTGLEGGGSLSSSQTLGLDASYESGAAYDGRFVNEDGDSMTGNLDMRGNYIQDVNTVNPNGELLRTGGNIEVQGGSVDTTCIGDQCT